MPLTRAPVLDAPIQDEPAEPPLVLRDFLPYRISVVAEAVSTLFATRYEERFGLSIPEWRVMAVLGEGGQQTTQQVIASTGREVRRVSGTAITGSTRQNSAGSSIRPCMKSPPTRVTYAASRVPPSSGTATTTTVARWSRASGERCR